MNMVEAWGSGIPKMFEEAQDYGLQRPELVDIGSDFRINLYRKRPVVDSYGVVDPKYVNDREKLYEVKDGTKVGTDGVIASKTMTDEEKLIVVIRGNGEITQKQMSQKTGKIRRVGNSRSGKWLA